MIDIRLRRKIAVPHKDLSISLRRLTKLQKASDLARRASRLVQLARRLDSQMTELDAPVSPTTTGYQDRVLAEAALTLSEMGKFINLNYGVKTLILARDAEVLRQEPQNVTEEEAPLSIRSIAALEVHLDALDSARERVTSEMEDMIRIGLTSLVIFSCSFSNRTYTKAYLDSRIRRYWLLHYRQRRISLSCPTWWHHS